VAVRESDPCRIRTLVESFLATARNSVLLEEGQEPILLQQHNYALEGKGKRLTLSAWDGDRSITRRLVAVEKELPGRLQLRIARLGRRTGRLVLYDQDRPQNWSVARRGVRLAAREWFRRFLSRHFPGWRINSLSGDPYLEQSLSPLFPRALVTLGSQGWAVMGAREESHADDVLTFGLIWLDYLRRKRLRTRIEGLTLVLPDGHHRTTCLRLRHLKAGTARFQVFVHGTGGWEDTVDLDDHGNLETHLEMCRDAAGLMMGAHPLLNQVLSLKGVEAVISAAGTFHMRVRGAEFARFENGALLFGIHDKRVAGADDVGEIRRLVLELTRLRSADNCDYTHPFRTTSPESWIESQVRANLEALGADLLPAPIYGQVPAFAGGSRGIIDLLAAERTGRLAVIELKATADPHLPLQALDYWMRVRWHLERCEFASRGYFPGLAIAPKPPRLLLVAPALEFHSTTETILGFFSSGIPVERLGLGADWRRHLSIVFHATGSEHPGLT